MQNGGTQFAIIWIMPKILGAMILMIFYKIEHGKA